MVRTTGNPAKAVVVVMDETVALLENQDMTRSLMELHEESHVDTLSAPNLDTSLKRFGDMNFYAVLGD